MEGTTANFTNNKDAFLNRFAKLFLPTNATGKINLVFKRGELISESDRHHQAKQEEENCASEHPGEAKGRRVL